MLTCCPVALTPDLRPLSAITQGMSQLIGDISTGKLADLVLWKPSNFGVRPEMVIKGGVIAYANVSQGFC